MLTGCLRQTCLDSCSTRTWHQGRACCTTRGEYHMGTGCDLAVLQLVACSGSPSGTNGCSQTAVHPHGLFVTTAAALEARHASCPVTPPVQQRQLHSTPTQSNNPQPEHDTAQIQRCLVHLSCMWLHTQCLNDCVHVLVTTATAVQHNLGAISQGGAQLLHSRNSMKQQRFDCV